ncbi:MAG: glycosyltransferase [Geothermobacteraceae bacterium]
MSYVTPSNWMADMGRQSGITANEFRVIPNGVDTELFRPRDRRRLREKLGLPDDKPLILVSAGSILDERKGSVFAVEALRRLGDTPFALLLIGNMNEAAHRMLSGLEYHAPGYLGESRELARYYACADLFLCCSLADNLPLVILETMSSGVPTVGFATGGIPDMIEQNRCGYLVEQRDIDGLVEGLKLALVDGLAVRWGEEARTRAVSHFSFDRFLQNHLDFYQELLEGRDGVGG